VAAAARAALLIPLALASLPAQAERLDHRGAVGLLVGGGLELKESVSARTGRDGGLRTDLDLGGTVAIGADGNELLGVARLQLGGPRLGTALLGGYRGYFGQDRFKTFFDLGAGVQLTPALTAGPRVGFGAQVELGALVGIYAGVAGQLAAGDGLRASVEAVLGFQVRSYLLE
jgi:hypothetical protein